MSVRDLMVTWIAQSANPVLTVTGLTPQKDSGRTFCLCLSSLFPNHTKTPHYSLHFDALWQIPFTLSTSHSSAVTSHLMKSKDSNLLFIINKSLHCEKRLLFVTALKTITVCAFQQWLRCMFHGNALSMVKVKIRFHFHHQGKEIRPDFLGHTMVNGWWF